jgi:hypothetical protein
LEGRLVPLDRNAKARIMVLARAPMRRSGEGKHYGVLTAKFVAVLGALLWGFHNAATGRCFPSYERIADKADCARSTVYEAIHALERAGLLTWVNRIARIREWGPVLVWAGAEPNPGYPHQQRLCPANERHEARRCSHALSGLMRGTFRVPISFCN